MKMPCIFEICPLIPFNISKKYAKKGLLVLTTLHINLSVDSIKAANILQSTLFFIRKNFYKKVSLKTLKPKTLRKSPASNA